LVQRSGFGTTRLFELFRQHYHRTPAEVLLRARLEHAKRHLLATDAGLVEIAADAGFESISVFHEHFRRRLGLTPGAYRELQATNRFVVTLPTGYPLNYLRRALSRDGHSASERFVGDSYVAAIRLSGNPALLRLQLSSGGIAAEISAGSAVEAHAIVCGLAGLDQDAGAFATLAKKLGLARLVAGRPELRISQTPSVFDGLLWSIVGQQINFPFACLLKRRLFERAGTPIDAGLFAPPSPAAVAALAPADLVAAQFSRQKASYLIDTSRLIVEGKLDLESLPALSATRAERTLLAIRGLGPWSVNYLMMRALGFPDCVPLGDTGVTSGLQAALKLEKRPDVDATRRLMAVFSPYRSLATAHLWQFNQTIPT
ncbi:MAG: helix-turn-helix domain-containing protein, partial [Opitutaceae bacterium]